MILTFDNQNWFFDMLRRFFATIDSLIYSLVSWILEGIFNLSGLTTGFEVAQTIYNRIYVVLALFMIFKLTLSFLQYIISPDKMVDKEQGVGKLIARVLIMVCLLTAFPILFFTQLVEVGDKKYTVLEAMQIGVIKTLPKIILGTDVNDDGIANSSVASVAVNNGEYMALEMLRAFYYPVDCEDDSVDQTKCSDATINNFEAFESSINIAQNGVYTYKYMWPLTTIAGIALVVILLGFAIDVAIRVFKLLLLQLVAPVPIMSYIDPKSSKDGAFSSWTKSFISTYLDIFIKLGTIYLLLLLFSKLFAENGLFPATVDGQATNQIAIIDSFMARSFVRVFLVLGLFKFAKDAPKFIKDALGMKDSGGGGGFMGKAVSGLAGAAAGFAGGMATGGLAGGLSGIMSGASTGAAGKPGDAFKQVRDEQAKLLGKTPGGIKGKLQNKAMQRSVMKHTGLDNDKLKELKNADIAAQELLAEKEAIFNANPHDADAKDEFLAARTAAAKASTAYSDANSLAKQIGLKKGFMEDNRRHGAIYVAATRAKRAAKSSEVGIAVSDIPKAVSDKASAVAKGAKDLYSGTRVGVDNILGRDGLQLEADREDLRAAKSEYKDMLRGGIGNSPKDDDLDAAQEAVRQARQTYRDDKNN